MKINVSIIDLVLSLSEAVDSASPTVENHHKQVAAVSYYISKQLGLSLQKQKEIVIAGGLHDIGALSVSDKIKALKFDFEDSINGHSEKGYMFLKTYKPFLNIANYVRYHHVPWNNGKCEGVNSEKVPLESHLLNLADRISVLINPNKNILTQVDYIREKISKYSGSIFTPELVEAFIELSKKESFWLDIRSNSLEYILRNNLNCENDLSNEEFSELIKLFSRIIDFRSEFTAAHSSGVASTAEAIAKIKGFTEDGCNTIKMSGYVHDLGKLAVPNEILEKHGKLTKEEYNIIRIHPYYTDKILKKVKNFDTIRKWGALHHERLDGNGYPFHLKGDQISTGSRIMAAADVFVALGEDRPYKSGLKYSKVMEIMNDMTPNALDKDIVKLIKDNYDIINNSRIAAQSAADEEYHNFIG